MQAHTTAAQQPPQPPQPRRRHVWSRHAQLLEPHRAHTAMPPCRSAPRMKRTARADPKHGSAPLFLRPPSYEYRQETGHSCAGTTGGPCPPRRAAPPPPAGFARHSRTRRAVALQTVDTNRHGPTITCRSTQHASCIPSGAAGQARAAAGSRQPWRVLLTTTPPAVVGTSGPATKPAPCQPHGPTRSPHASPTRPISPVLRMRGYRGSMWLRVHAPPGPPRLRVGTPATT